MYVHMSIYIYIYIYILTYTHTYIHTYIHTHACRAELLYTLGAVVPLLGAKIIDEEDVAEKGIQHAIRICDVMGQIMVICAQVGRHPGCVGACMYVCMYVYIKNKTYRRPRK